METNLEKNKWVAYHCCELWEREEEKIWLAQEMWGKLARHLKDRNRDSGWSQRNWRVRVYFGCCCSSSISKQFNFSHALSMEWERERERGTWMLLPAFGTYSLSLSLSLRLTFFEILDSRLLTQYYHFIFFFFFFFHQIGWLQNVGEHIQLN